ncbi:MAG: gamma-glutamyltransferase [Alphaproteobacteria bacterium]
MVEVRGAHAVVAAGHPLACAAAVEAMAAGGGTVDAAIAAAFVLAVACPHAATLGGDVFLLIHDAASGETAGVNGTGTAPAAIAPALFPDGIPRSGPLVSTVPGLVAGLEAAHRRFGRLPFGRLLAPAIGHARQGFAVGAYLAANVARCAELLAGDPAAAALFLPGGSPLAEGDRLAQPALAASLERIAGDGAAALYGGDLGAALAGDLAAVGAPLSAGDLAGHRTLWQAPLAAPFHGRSVLTMPPNSYGLTLLLQLLLLSRDNIAAVDPDGPAFALRGLAARRAADRAAAAAVADPAEAEALARSVLADAVAGRLADGPEPAEAEGGTTNVVVLDAAGNAVSLVMSVSAPFGACVVSPRTGILMNNRLRGFALDPASANRLAPGRRPAHTLTPALVLRDGRPEWAIGTPGTAGQTCVLAQLLARLLACGQEPSAAFAAPRWSVDLEGRPIVEKTMPEAVRAAIADSEPDVRPMPVGWQTFGSVKACRRDADGLAAFADRRRSADVAALDRGGPA